MKNLRNQIVFIVAVLVVWQVVYQMGSFPELMFPSLGKIFQSLIKGFSRDGLGAMTLYSLSLIAERAADRNRTGIYPLRTVHRQQDVLFHLPYGRFPV